MIVIIEDEVFTSQAGLALQSLFWLGYEGRHLVQTDPPYKPEGNEAVNRWLAGLDTLSREQAELALEIGVEQAVKASPPEITIRIAEVTSADWAAASPRLPLTDALGLLYQPLRLLVEDQQSDGTFLLSVPPSPWATSFGST